MYRKILIGGVTAAAIVGAGGTALAVTGDDVTAGTPSPSSSSSSPAQPGAHKADKKKHGKGALLRRLSHAQIVTKGKGGTYVTHDLITGTVSSVSSTSITVQAADKTAEKFTVTKDTKVRSRTVAKKGSGEKAKASDSTIGAVKKGDRVMVTGTGKGTPTAKHIVDIHGTR